MALTCSSLPGLRPASRICLGTATFGTAQMPRDAAFALLDAFAGAGGSFVDTAHVYAAWLPDGAGASERTLGAWMRDRGHDLLIGSKGGHPPLDNMGRSRLRPEDLRQDCGESLERLQRERIDLYWLHRDDESIPVGEIVDALQPLLAAGRIGAIGASNWRHRRIAEANAWAATHGAIGFAASQIAWSLAEDAPSYVPYGGTLAMDAGTLAWHAASGVAQIPYSSQAGGFFAKPLPTQGRYACPANAARHARVRAEAARRGVTPNALALAWVLQHPAGGWAVAGPHTAAQLADTLAADAIALSAVEVADLAG